MKEKNDNVNAVVGGAVLLVLSNAFILAFIAWLAILLKFGVWFYYWLG